MGAVGVLARNEIRQRWRSTLAIMILIGIVGAIVLATAAGARRSGTALERFNAFSRTSNMEISVGVPTEQQLAEFRASPGVASVALIRAYAIGVDGLQELVLAAPIGAAMDHLVDRSLLISGRRTNRSAPNEITVGETLADQLHLKIGDRLKTVSYTQEQRDNGFSGGKPGPPAGPQVQLRVVGIVRRPLDLGVRAATGGVIILSQAFSEKYDDQIGTYTDVLRVKTERGSADVPRVAATAQRMFGKEQTFGTESLAIETEGARNAIDVLTLSLWIVAGVAALAGFVAIGIVLTRDIARADVDQPTLRALGLTRRERIALHGPRAVIFALGGAVLAGIGAFCLSPLLPFGVARRADPNPGLHADWTVLLIAIPVVAVLILGVAWVAAARASRNSSFEPAPHAYRRTSAVVERAAAAGLSPTATNGLRMAIQSGRGNAAVPTRSAFAGAIFGVAGVVAALVFAASLSHLGDTPRLYGWTFDLTAEVPAASPCADPNDFGVKRGSDIEAVAKVCQTSIQIDGKPATVTGFQFLHGTIDPEVVAGRAPRGPNEIALGSVTLDALHKHIGDTVHARGQERRHDFVVVGRVVLPAVGEPQALADGATVTPAGFLRIYRHGKNETDFLVARLRPGTDRDTVVRRLSHDVRKQLDDGSGLDFEVGVPKVPVEVSRLQQVDRIPVYLAALLGFLALVAVGHALVTGVRRRRRELALLKSLGFDRRQVRATVAWQATTLGAVGLAIGIPIGVVLGRVVWDLVAKGLGVSTEVVAPVLAIVLTVPCVLLLVNAIAYFPARAAARTRPAVILRSQ